MRAAAAIARAREQAGEGVGAERDGLGIESGSGEQVEMAMELCFGCESGDHETRAILAADTGEGDRGVVDGEREMLLEGEGDYLVEAAAVGEGQGEKPLGD